MRKTQVKGEKKRRPRRGQETAGAWRLNSKWEAKDKGGYELDLSGVPCPNSFVRAKWRMESMAIGETLTLILDRGEAIRNVPGSFLREGQEVLQITASSDGRWQVVVRKKSVGGLAL